MAKGAEASFCIGKALFEIKMSRDQGIFWKDFVKDNFEFSVTAANNHIRLFLRFKDTPDAVKDKTIKELNGDKERVNHAYNRITEGGGTAGGTDAWDAIFSMPTVSGAPLKNFRFETVGGDSLWMYDRKAGMRARALRLEAFEVRPDTKNALALMMNTIQSAVERYYAALEAMDQDG
jgi:hypothetical protein